MSQRIDGIVMTIDEALASDPVPGPSVDPSESDDDCLERLCVSLSSFLDRLDVLEEKITRKRG